MARSKPTPTKPVELILYAVDGEDIDKGSTHPVPYEQPLLIGRTTKGLKLLDPLVSIRHAQIVYDVRRGYIIEDLGSATGTWVDGVCITSDSRPIGVNTKLRFGDTVFEVRSQNRMPKWMNAVGAFSIAMVAFAALLAGLTWVFGGGGEPLRLVAPEPIVVEGAAYDIIPVPTWFLRERGLLVVDLSIRSVTDHDYNGVSEVWLDIADDRGAVITFEGRTAKGTPEWKVLGDFPERCNLPPKPEESQGFPVLECNGTLWVLGPDGYELRDHDGPVVYYVESITGGGALDELLKPLAPQEEPAGGHDANGGAGTVRKVRSKDLRVARFVLKNKDHLAGFLADRGVDGPVHYVICDEAFEGIKKQALMSDGTIRPLSFGCINDLRLEGIVEGKPVAIALSAVGHRALVDDVITFYAGNPDGLWLPSERRVLADAVRRSPGRRQGGTKLVANSSQPDVALFDPVPDVGRALATPARQLENTDLRVVPAPPAYTAIVTEPGGASLDPEGCASLIVETNAFASRRWRTFLGWPFMTVSDVGCGERRELVQAGYGAIGTGVHDASIGDLQVRVVVEGRNPSGRHREVARARVTYRQLPGASSSSAARGAP
ncbi:MAG: FHA domain-containing protein [Myxococcales bacterium]|nr:FHA domain-containing protein [Myxococcales bacterium]